MARKCAQCGKKLRGFGPIWEAAPFVKGDPSDESAALDFCSEEHREAYRSWIKQAAERESTQIAGTERQENLSALEEKTAEAQAEIEASCAECGNEIPAGGGYKPLIQALGDVRFCSRDHRTAHESRWRRDSEQTGAEELDAGSGNGGISDGKGTIARLADFYSVLTVYIFWLFICGCVLGLLGVILTEGSPLYASILGLSFLGVIATGTSAVLLDTMHNIREINRK